MSHALFTTIAKELGGTLRSVERLKGGCSAQVHALEISASGESFKVVHRQHSDLNFFGEEKEVAQKEYDILNALHARSFAVAKPLCVEPAQGWLVTEFVVGKTSFRDAGEGQSIDELTSFLHKLHDVDIEQLELPTLNELEDPLAGLLRFLSAEERSLRSAIEAKEIEVHRNASVLLHGDYWPGNWIFHEGTLQAVIDWEDAAQGDPLADLACARVELLCHCSDDTMVRFTKAYADKSGVDMRSLALWDAYVSASALATMHQWKLKESEEARRRTLTQSFLSKALSALR